MGDLTLYQYLLKEFMALCALCAVIPLWVLFIRP